MKLSTGNLAILTMLIVIMQSACNFKRELKVESPSGYIRVTVELTGNDQVSYAVHYKGKKIINPSVVGFDFLNRPSISEGLSITGSEKKTFNETWEMPWGEQRFVTNHYNELRVFVQEKTALKRVFSLVFRVFDDGLGFRIEFPEQENMKEVFITEENTWFNLAGDHECWWLPGDWDISEHLYSHTRFSEIDAISKRNHPNLAQTYIPVNAVLTPFTMKTGDGIYLSFHEAALIDYAGITLKVYPGKLAMRSNLVGSWRKYKVDRKTPFSTPWRTIQIAQEPGKLIESRMLLNLNEPNRLGDVSWIKPTKYVGIWWEMHLGKSTWAYSDVAGGKPHGRHGATTENAKKFIDFAAANNIGAVLIEGWNTGWENWIGTADREGIFDFVTPYPDYDLQEVVRYAKAKGVRLIMHHETSAAVSTYEKQLDSAYALMESLGMDMVKTGYVGTIIPTGEYHHNQFMVNHYQKVIETAARHKVAVNSHESIMPTGLRRTYPNELTSENLRGQEFNAWATDGGNPPSHLPTVAFTRMLAGPIDYTPGIFNIKLDPYRPDNQVNTTLAQQLALYVVIYSPLQMVADLPGNYENHPAFQFIRDVGVDWEQSRVLNGAIGEYVTIARQERNTGNWFLGSITNELPRQFIIKADFLDPSKKYIATLYTDSDDAHWDHNPTAYVIKQFEADSGSEIELNLAPGGGVAISFMVDN